MDPTINHISLCTGYGGIDLGLRAVLPTCRTITCVEIEAFACANLVAKMEAGELDSAPIFTDLHTFDARPYRGHVGILSGGFPCQPFSQAGSRRSDEDPRHLFPQIQRIIDECRPGCVFLENVEGIISARIQGAAETSVLLHVLDRLEARGYTATWGLFSAAECGAPHRRNRVFILAVADTADVGSEERHKPRQSRERKAGHALPCGQEMADRYGGGQQVGTECNSQPNEGRPPFRYDADRRDHPMADRDGTGLEGWIESVRTGSFQWPTGPSCPQGPDEPARTTQPGLGRAVDGPASRRVDRLRLLGNGVVPQTAAVAFSTLLTELIERRSS